jgi:hypothetical protein
LTVVLSDVIASAAIQLTAIGEVETGDPDIGTLIRATAMLAKHESSAAARPAPDRSRR